MKPELKFAKKKMNCAELGEESSIPDILGEHILQNNLTFMLDEDDEIYEGYGRRRNAYPYRKYDSYTRSFTEKDVKTAVLENRYLKAVFLTEYGGRLWELWDKITGHNLLYTNDVLLFGNLAVRNAWFSGGVEWNIGIIGHTPLTTEPLYVATTELEDGTPVLRMYEYERIRRLTYQMDFWIKEEDRFLNCRMRVVNENETVVPMYWWSNIAVPEHEDGRVIVPAQKAFTYADGKVWKTEIPYINGIDITDYNKIEKSVDYFFDISKNSPKYIANVNKAGYGLLQLSTARLQSRKLFSWGKSPASDRWQEFLTDRAGRYVEIQAGLAKTQYGCIPMAPHTAWEWMEQYGAVQVSEEVMKGEHADRVSELTGKVIEQHLTEKLEEVLEETKAMAHKAAKLVSAGSGYGAMDERRRYTNHLRFELEDGSLVAWKRFFASGVLHCPSPEERPDVFVIDENNVGFLETNMKNKNEKNWYAHYHLGLGYYAESEYEKAEKEFLKSVEMEKNPWAYHALACTCMQTMDEESAVENILQGMKMRRQDVSYLKDGFKILHFCKAYEELCDMYEKLERSVCSTPRLMFYYICALHGLGKDEQAFSLLEKDGGLEMPDIREGEESIARLWKELYENLYGEAGEIPYKYAFCTF